MVSSHDWMASAREIIPASLARMTACECSGLPNAVRCCVHLRHSSTIMRCERADAQHMTQRSWLKFESMTKMPPPSGPSVFSTGTLTLSNVMYAVPAEGEYDVLIGLVSTPSPRSTRMTVKPSWTWHYVRSIGRADLVTYLCLASYGEVIGEGAVGDPLLRSAHNPVLSIFGLGCGSLKSCDVASRKSTPARTSVIVFKTVMMHGRFGNGEADELLPGQHVRHNPGLNLVRSKVENRRQADDLTQPHQHQ
jgi:hypothetical protein